MMNNSSQNFSSNFANYFIDINVSKLVDDFAHKECIWISCPTLHKKQAHKLKLIQHLRSNNNNIRVADIKLDKLIGSDEEPTDDKSAIFTDALVTEILKQWNVDDCKTSDPDPCLRFMSCFQKSATNNPDAEFLIVFDNADRCVYFSSVFFETLRCCASTPEYNYPPVNQVAFSNWPLTFLKREIDDCSDTNSSRVAHNWFMHSSWMNDCERIELEPINLEKLKQYFSSLQNTAVLAPWVLKAVLRKCGGYISTLDTMFRFISKRYSDLGDLLKINQTAKDYQRFIFAIESDSSLTKGLSDDFASAIEQLSIPLLISSPDTTQDARFKWPLKLLEYVRNTNRAFGSHVHKDFLFIGEDPTDFVEVGLDTYFCSKSLSIDSLDNIKEWLEHSKYNNIRDTYYPDRNPNLIKKNRAGLIVFVSHIIVESSKLFFDSLNPDFSSQQSNYGKTWSKLFNSFRTASDNEFSIYVEIAQKWLDNHLEFTKKLSYAIGTGRKLKDRYIIDLTESAFTQLKEEQNDHDLKLIINLLNLGLQWEAIVGRANFAFLDSLLRTFGRIITEVDMKNVGDDNKQPVEQFLSRNNEKHLQTLKLHSDGSLEFPALIQYILWIDDYCKTNFDFSISGSTDIKFEKWLSWRHSRAHEMYLKEHQYDDIETQLDFHKSLFDTFVIACNQKYGLDLVTEDITTLVFPNELKFL